MAQLRISLVLLGGLCMLGALSFLGPCMAYLSHNTDPLIGLRLSTESYISISGWYGPGTWLVYVITVISAVHRTLYPMFNDRVVVSSWDLDLITAALYTFISSGDLIRQLSSLKVLGPQIPPEKIPSLGATSTAVHASLALIVPTVLTISFVHLLPFIANDRQWVRLRSRIAFSSIIVWSLMFVSAWSSTTVFAVVVYRLELPDSAVLAKDLFRTRAYYHNLVARSFIEEGGHRIYWDPLYVGGIILIALLHCRFRAIVLLEGLKDRAAACVVVAPAAAGYFLVFPILVYFIAFGFVCTWSCLWLMLVPGTGWFPDTGIDIRELDQCGALLTLLIVYLIRGILWVAKRSRGPNDKDDVETTTPILDIGDTRNN